MMERMYVLCEFPKVAIQLLGTIWSPVGDGEEMNKLACLLAVTLFALSGNEVKAMTCEEFNAIGYPADSLDQIVNQKPTSAQFEVAKKTIAEHASKLAALSLFSTRGRTVNAAVKNDRLAWFVGNAIALTRSECFLNPRSDMENVAEEQFNFLLDSAAE